MENIDPHSTDDSFCRVWHMRFKASEDPTERFYLLVIYEIQATHTQLMALRVRGCTARLYESLCNKPPAVEYHRSLPALAVADYCDPERAPAIAEHGGTGGRRPATAASRR